MLLCNMLAFNHATLASATALGLSLYFKEPFFLPLIIFVIFAGVLPDIDHPGSELGRWFKPVGKMLPHRGITHSFFGAFLFTGGIYLLLGSQYQYFRYFGVFGAVFGVYLLEKILHHNINKIDDYSKNLIQQKQIKWLLKIVTVVLYIFLAILIFLVWNNQMSNQIYQLLVIGYLAHIVGDFVTIEGVPLFYPIKKKLGLKLFKTGSGQEAFIGFCLVILNIYLTIQFVQVNNVNSLDYWSKYVNLGY